MVRNECADEMIREMVIRHGVSVTIRPAPAPSRNMGNCCQLVMQFGDRKEATIIDFDRIDHSRAKNEMLECDILVRCFERLFTEPFHKMIDKHFFEGGINNAR